MDTDIARDAKLWYGENWDPDLSVGEWFQLMYESGWGYPTWPVQWGGKGLPIAVAKEVRAARRAVGALSPPSGIGPSLLAPMLFQHGSDEQCDRLLRGMAYQGITVCQMLSEPDAGSDLAVALYGGGTRRVRVADHRYQDLDQQRVRRRLRHAAGADQLGCPQAPRSLVFLVSGHPGRSRGSDDQADERAGRVQPGPLQCRRRGRSGHARRGGRGMGGREDVLAL